MRKPDGRNGNPPAVISWTDGDSDIDGYQHEQLMPKPDESAPPPPYTYSSHNISLGTQDNGYKDKQLQLIRLREGRADLIRKEDHE